MRVAGSDSRLSLKVMVWSLGSDITRLQPLTSCCVGSTVTWIDEACVRLPFLFFFCCCLYLHFAIPFKCLYILRCRDWWSWNAGTGDLRLPGSFLYGAINNKLLHREENTRQTHRVGWSFIYERKWETAVKAFSWSYLTKGSRESQNPWLRQTVMYLEHLVSSLIFMWHFVPCCLCLYVQTMEVFGRKVPWYWWPLAYCQETSFLQAKIYLCGSNCVEWLNWKILARMFWTWLQRRPLNGNRHSTLYFLSIWWRLNVSIFGHWPTHDLILSIQQWFCCYWLDFVLA